MQPTISQLSHNSKRVAVQKTVDFDFISTFAGIGGFDLGLERAGFHCILQIENNQVAASILERHFPDTKRLGDIRDAGKQFDVQPVSILVGGFPCQDVSTAGKRKGLAGSQSGLWFEFHRLIREIRPAWVVIENVPGLLSTHQGKDFATVLGGLIGAIPDVPDTGWKSAGAVRGTRGFYHVCWRILDAQYFGVPQRRRRVFIVANLTEAGGGCAEVLFESQSGSGHSQPRKKTGQAVAATLNASAPNRRNGGSDPTAGHFILEESAAISGTLGAAAGINRGLGNANETDFLINTFQFQRSDSYSEGSGNAPLVHRDYKSARDLISVETLDVRNLELHENSAPLQSKDQGYSLNFTNPIAFNYKASADVDQPVRQDGNAGTLQVAGSEAVYGLSNELTTSENMLPNLQYGSETGGGHPSMVNHLSGVRRLTPIECARLQGFPDDWCEGLSDSQQYRLYGNAVAVPVIEWIGQHLMQVILKQQEQPNG